MIVKYGGNAMKSLELRRVVAREIAALRAHLPVVVVHGGGPVIEAELSARGVPSEFRQGLRVTSPEAMHVVEMALAKLNKELSADIGQALGLMGRDAALLVGELLLDGAGLATFGRVGRVTEVNAALLRTLLGVGLTPVVGCVAVDVQGEPLNVNADWAAGAVAGALEEGIVFLTDVDGVYRAYPDPDSLVHMLGAQEVRLGIDEGWIAGGMIPKVQAALEALSRGAPFATIASGMAPGVLTRAATGEAGTRIVP
ncbi:acetylglutamate kinase [Deinococcus peraridilitoris]|uniref:Acetylglutamate kinase n=1 Tax=Deinococcus peraridilitoris (strain DSM 19664 / LMG 22246 / CIP 109416 / KR-200) TaxID=937777 RepID=L0A4F0_DEIPD|nr:acetylglutamate kinase [Deinococcus peraridilitoris]AFZ67905.1 acetylglutamate kinase [Deinococcus peraridilitoris DSM 19664]